MTRPPLITPKAALEFEARRHRDYQIVHAAAWDAGNRSARKAGRSVWTEEDYNAAVDEFHRLYPKEYCE